MELREASLLRVFFSEDDVYGEQPLYVAVLRAAHDAKLAGATALRGIGGYGPTSLQVKFFQFRTEARPVVVEIIDSEAKVEAFLPTVAAMVESGAITVERIRFASTGHG